MKYIKTYENLSKFYMEQEKFNLLYNAAYDNYHYKKLMII